MLAKPKEYRMSSKVEKSSDLERNYLSVKATVPNKMVMLAQHMFNVMFTWSFNSSSVLMFPSQDVHNTGSDVIASAVLLGPTVFEFPDSDYGEYMNYLTTRR